MEKKYTASMLANGNHLFQASITVCIDGLKLKIPKFWKNKETFFRYHDISGFSLNTPSWYTILSYCTMSFNAKGTWVEVHGFTKSDARKIQKHIEEGQRGSGVSKNQNSLSINKRDTHEEWKQKSRQEVDEFRAYIRHLGEEHRQKEEEERERYHELLHKNKSVITKHFELLYIYKSIKDEKGYKETQFNLVKSKKNLNIILRKLGAKEAFEEIITECKNSGIAKAKEDISDAKNQSRINIESIVDEVFQKANNEIITEEDKHNPYSFPTFENLQFPHNTINGKKEIRSLVTSLIYAYDQLDIDYLEDDDNIEENKYIVSEIIKSVLNGNGRESFINYIDDLEGDINQYAATAKSLVNLIFDIYGSGLSKMEDETGQLKFPFALEREKMKVFLSNNENSNNDKISKIIDATDNIIDRFDKWLN